MSDKPKVGRRITIYLPPDLLDQWDRTPRYERSAAVAAALREYWKKHAEEKHEEGGTHQRAE